MKLPNYQKPSQKNLFGLGREPMLLPRWHDGANIDYLGRPLQLKLDTDRRQAMRENNVLHLPLPPDANARQIQDAAESWLRREAEVLFTRIVANETQLTRRGMPAISLSFSLRGSWVQAEHRLLRLNWRLIQQPLPAIELALRRAVAMLPATATTGDLFAVPA